MFLRSLLSVLVLGIAFLPGRSFASFAANCQLEVELVTADVVVHKLGGVLYQRSVSAKVLKATTGEISHIDCEKVYLGKTITFPLQLLATPTGNEASTLGLLKPGAKLNVHYQAMNGRAAWGGAIDAQDWWLLK